VRCYHFARALASRGFETGVLSFRDHLSPETSEAMMYGLGDRDKLRLTGRALWRLLRARDTLLVLQKLHYHSAAPVLLQRLGRFPLVFDLDDWDEHCLAMFRRGWLNRFFFGPGGYGEHVARIAGRAPFCIAASHSLLEILSRHNPRVHLVETVVDEQQFPYRERTPGERTRLIWTGVVWGETVFNSVLLMLESFAAVAPRHPEAELALLAGGQLLPRLKEVLAERFSGLPVRLLDWVAPGEVPALLHGADIGLLPLAPDHPDDLWVRSKSPTKLFEYMSTGLPVVASAVGEVCHVIEDGVHGFLAEDAAAFTERLELLLDRPELRRRMGRAARERIEQRYCLGVLGERLAEIFAPYR